MLGAELGGYLYFGSNINDTEFNTKLYRVPVNGTQVEMFKDLNAPWPQNFVAAGTHLFFTVSDELWKSDGTKEGTKIVRYNTTAGPLVAMGNEVYFSGTGGLWKSDGTYAGTVAVDPGSGASNVTSITASGGLLYFIANINELWKFDGTTSTELSASLNLSNAPQDLSAFGSSGAAFWGWADSSATVNVWATDGTTITNLISTAPTLSMLDLETANNKIFFAKNTVAGSDPRLYTSDGTLAGTTLLDINPGTATNVTDDLTAAGSLLYFHASTTAAGSEWWALNTNTMLSTMLEITPGSGSTASSRWIAADTGQLFFRADNGTGNGFEPWISNGTVPGTQMVDNLAPGAEDGWSNSNWPVVAQGKFFFDTRIIEANPELWRSDGTAAGTVQVTHNIDYRNAGSDPGDITESGGAGFFCAADEDGRELWRTDGSTAGTLQVHDLNVGNASGCLDDWVVSAGGFIYFYGSDGTNSGLWKSDGTTATAVRSLNTIQQVVTIGSVIYFRGDDGSGFGQELWSSDGSPDGTAMLKDIYTPAGQSSNIQGLSVVNGKLVFSARNVDNGTELWVSNGTGSGTLVLRNIAEDFVGNPPTSSSPNHLTVIGTKLYFSADNQTDGNELWVTDGTSVGTLFVDDIGPGALDGDPREFVALGSYVYFNANENGGRGEELWRTDGTAAGTSIVQDIVTGPDSSYPYALTVAGAFLYFTADDGIVGQELWKTDGTTTSMVKNIKPVGSDGSYPENLYPSGIGNTIYFTAEDADNDVELWISDGTEANTQVLADINPVDSSSPQGFFTLGSQIIFRATTPDSGQELWTFGEADCGDAPDPMLPTLIANAGACHKIEVSVTEPVLGALRDADPDGQPLATADGDDTDGIDDEDGVSFTSAFTIASTGTLEVTLNASGVLNAWIDWQGNGNWSDAADQVIHNLPIDAGTQSFSIPVPSDGVNPGSVNARFRVTSTGISSFDGIYNDGEVEDYQITLVDNLDFGDAPAPYPTLSADNGASHRLVAGIYMGSLIDKEDDGQPTVNADGDDLNNLDDDDGVTFNNVLIPSGSGDIDVVVSVDGYLNGWVDFNQDGDWNDPGENVVGDQWVIAGVNNLIFPIPAAASNGATYARFRFDTDSYGWQPTGPAPEGEVEDYRVLVGGNPPVADAGQDHLDVDLDTESVVLGGSPSASAGTSPYTYQWLISPGSAGTDYYLSSMTVANPIFIGYTEDLYTAALTVIDDNGLQATDDALLDVLAYPAVRNITGLNLGGSGPETFGACEQLVVDLTTILTGSEVTFIAPEVVLGSEFTVQDLAIFKVINQLPAECPLPE